MKNVLKNKLKYKRIDNSKTIYFNDNNNPIIAQFNSVNNNIFVENYEILNNFDSNKNTIILVNESYNNNNNINSIDNIIELSEEYKKFNKEDSICFDSIKEDYYQEIKTSFAESNNNNNIISKTNTLTNNKNNINKKLNFNEKINTNFNDNFNDSNNSISNDDSSSTIRNDHYNTIEHLNKEEEEFKNEPKISYLTHSFLCNNKFNESSTTKSLKNKKTTNKDSNKSYKISDLKNTGSINIIEENEILYNSLNNRKDNEKIISNFLKEIDLDEKYKFLLIQSGFDDFNLLIEQIKNDCVPITYKNLKEIGIIKSGDCFKILLHLEEKANLFSFPFDYEKIYFFNERNNNFLYRFLSSMYLENYLNNFLMNGFSSPELMFLIMNSKNVINESVLNEIGIEKIGYRMRIISKIKNDSKIYINKCKNNFLDKNNNNNNEKGTVVFEKKEEFCNTCLIF